MSTEQKPQPVIIDADTYDPVPRNVFRFKGQDYPAFDVLQISNAARERVKRLEEHLKACRSVEAQVELFISILADLVPTAPLDELRDRPVDQLSGCVIGLAVAIGSDGEARPTKGRQKSDSRRSTGR